MNLSRLTIPLVAGLLALGPVAAAGPLLPVEGTLTAQGADASGRVALSGRARTIGVPMDVDGGSVPDAELRIAGDLRIREDYRDYVGTPAGYVGKDDRTHTDRSRIDDGNLTLDRAGNEVRILVVPTDPDAPPTIRSSLRTADVDPRSSISTRLFSEPGSSPPEWMERRHREDGPAVQVQSGRSHGPAEVSGAFTVWLWDVDLVGPDGVHRSGVHRSNGTARTDLTPHGAVHDARIQILTVTVRDGRLTMDVPERTIHTHLVPGRSQAETTGTWILDDARGTLRSRDASRSVTGERLVLDGRIQASFLTSDDADRLATRWAGRVDCDDAALSSAPAPGTPVPSGSWLVLVAVVAVGGVAAWTVRSRDRSHADPGLDIETGDYERALRSADRRIRREGRSLETLIPKAVALMKLDRLEDVVELLEPSFDPDDPGGATCAYLLAMAHIGTDRPDAAAEWAVRAVELQRFFGYEIQENEVFAPIRDHPTVRDRLPEVERSYV